jgi:hypothetical protein
MLKMNPQFVSLVKQLWIKYGGFEKYPPEHSVGAYRHYNLIHLCAEE